MPASCRVANIAMEAPTGPEGVRPCDCTAVGMAEPTSNASDSHKPAGCMARLYPRSQRRTSLRLATHFVRPNGSIFSMLERVFVESAHARFL